MLRGSVGPPALSRRYNKYSVYSVETKHSPLLLLLHSSIARFSTHEYEIRGWLFAFPTVDPTVAVLHFSPTLFSQFVALTILSAYLFPSTSIFNIHRWNFSTIFLLRSGKYRVIMRIYVDTYIRATLKNIKLGVTVYREFEYDIDSNLNISSSRFA